MSKLEKLFIAIDNDIRLCQNLNQGCVLEENIENLLDKLGFRETTKDKLKNNTYAPQPNGRYAAPDIIVMEKNKTFILEIKSTSKSHINKKPFWNRNTPQENVIYIFGIKDIGVNYFLGQDILSPVFSKLLYGFFKDYLNVSDLFTNYLEERGITNKENLLGFTPIIAPQFAERKENATNWEQGYFSIPWSSIRKGNVKKWIREELNDKTRN